MNEGVGMSGPMLPCVTLYDLSLNNQSRKILMFDGG